MADYYVAKTGSDANPGSVGSPWLTILSHLAGLVAGDTIWIKVGTYVESLTPGGFGGVSWPLGASGNLISIRAFGDTDTTTKGVSAGTDAVVIRPSGGNGFGFNRNDCKYILVGGLVVDGGAQSSGFGIALNNDANNLLFRNVEVKNWGDDGVETSTSNGSATTDRNNIFKHMSVHGNGTLHSGVAKHGFYLRSRNTIVDGCDIYENDASSVQFYNSTSSARYAHNCIVRYCIMRENMIEYHFQQEGLSVGPNMTNFKGHNNLIYRHRDVGIDMTNGTNTDGVYLYNNTICDIGNGVPGNGENGIRITHGSYTNVFIKNNLFYDLGGAAIDDAFGVAVTANNFLNTGNPFFAGYTQGSAWNLTLSGSTPSGITIGGADLGSEYYTDFAGNARSGTFSIGAYSAGGAPPDPPLDPVIVHPDSIATRANVNALFNLITIQDNNASEIGDYEVRFVLYDSGVIYNGL